jgi:hypothetical protein
MDSGFTIDIFKLFFEKRVIAVIVINVRKYVFFMAVSLANLDNAHLPNKHVDIKFSAHDAVQE